jgi:Rap1a immunity proteins
MKMLVVGALAALTVATAAAPSPRIGNDVVPYCKLAPKEAAANGTSANAYAYCLGAIDGLVMGAWQKRNFEDPGCFDVPEKAFIERETLKVVLGYADRHPGELTQPFVRVAGRALREAWPCKTTLWRPSSDVGTSGS